MEVRDILEAEKVVYTHTQKKKKKTYIPSARETRIYPEILREREVNIGSTDVTVGAITITC